MSKVLIVDDDPQVLTDTKNYFKTMDYEVLTAENAKEAWNYLTTASLDCIILDFDMPGENGFDLCTRIRERTGIPIIFLSCYTETASRIRGLSVGGDDYVCKPYSLEELELRVRARIRCGRSLYTKEPLIFGELTIDPADRTVCFGEHHADVSTYEFDVLYLLASHPGQVFSYEKIFDQIWQAPVNKGIKALQMVIVRLRQKLNRLCPQHEYIRTIRRKGYFFTPLP